MRLPLATTLLFLLTIPVFAATDVELIAAGRAAMERGDFAKASDLFEKATTANPKNAEAFYWLGAAAGRQAQGANIIKQASLAKKAQSALERAVQLNPNSFEARQALVDYYTIAPGFMGGSEEKALAQAAELQKRDAYEGAHAYARIYMRDKKMDQARKVIVDLVRSQPNSAKAHQMLGVFFLSEKNYSGALHELEMVLKLDANYMPAHYRLGQLAALTGQDYARGEAGLRKYVTYKPADNEPPVAGAWYWLGMLYEKQGRKADAKQSFLNAQKLAPIDPKVKEALKRVQ
ncbi:MAG: tetratricopeptide repeat protein [Acidobacteriota bacterium]|nr:tetratricopeptide repeat protein [Acidobacteriota bacterium]